MSLELPVAIVQHRSELTDRARGAMRLRQANTVGAAQTAMRQRQRQPQGGGGGGARKHWGAAYDDSSAEWDALTVPEPPEQSSAWAAREFRAPFSSGTEREAFSMSMDEISLRL